MCPVCFSVLVYLWTSIPGVLEDSRLPTKILLGSSKYEFSVENGIFNLSGMALIYSVDHRFGETDLPIDDIAAVFLLVNFFSVSF